MKFIKYHKSSKIQEHSTKSSKPKNKPAKPTENLGKKIALDWRSASEI